MLYNVTYLIKGVETTEQVRSTLRGIFDNAKNKVVKVELAEHKTRPYRRLKKKIYKRIYTPKKVVRTVEDKPKQTTHLLAALKKKYRVG